MLLLGKGIQISPVMSLRSKVKNFFDAKFVKKLTCFQGSTLRFLHSNLILNAGKTPWICIQGSNHKISGLSYKYQLETPRGRSYENKYYSYGYSDSSLETKQIFFSIIMEHYDDIAQVLGLNFLVNDPTFWRITHIPKELSANDIYSQVFHQDSVRDNFNIQIFVLLQDINDSDGPFEWIDKKFHREAFSQCTQRNQTTVTNIPIRKLVGKKNDYLILSTGQTLHRDGIPNLQRERIMASIALFPKYTKIGKPFEFNK